MITEGALPNLGGTDIEQKGLHSRQNGENVLLRSEATLICATMISKRKLHTNALMLV
jgi:hypothetical protein